MKTKMVSVLISIAVHVMMKMILETLTKRLDPRAHMNAKTGGVSLKLEQIKIKAIHTDIQQCH